MNHDPRPALRDRVAWRMHRAKVRLSRPLVRAGLHTKPVDNNYGFNRGKPIDRYYIEKFLENERDAIAGRVLEIEHDFYTRRYGGARVARADTLHVDPAFRSATITADLADAPQIQSGSYDCLIICQTMQFIYDLKAAVATIHRILSPGGVALVTLPVTSRLHAPEHKAEFEEYWRFSSMSARRLFGEVFDSANVRVVAYGNLLTSQAHLAGLATEDMRRVDLEAHDPLYELLIGVRADKRTDGAGKS